MGRYTFGAEYHGGDSPDDVVDGCVMAWTRDLDEDIQFLWCEMLAAGLVPTCYQDVIAFAIRSTAQRVADSIAYDPSQEVR